MLELSALAFWSSWRRASDVAGRRAALADRAQRARGTELGTVGNQAYTRLLRQVAAFQCCDIRRSGDLGGNA
eukprot:6718125-Pyramimonas_sp.AAC.1